MKATVFMPGKAPRTLSTEEVKCLVWGICDGLLTCGGQETETALGVGCNPGTDVLHVTDKVAVWGVADAYDGDAKRNREASKVAKKFHPMLSNLVGPILIVEAE